MANDLVIVNNRRAATTAIVPSTITPERQDIYRACSRAGWVMVPGLNYRRKIETVVADQFDRMADSLEDKRMLVSEHLLDMVGMLKRMIIEDVQAAAYRWACAEAKMSYRAAPEDVITRDDAADEALRIIGDHFAILHGTITEFSLVDFTDHRQKLIILELKNLQSYINRYVIILILGWM